MFGNTDYYQVLGVSESATPEEIRKAYRRLAARHHPDRNPDDAAAEQRFKDVNQAHEVLGDQKKRAAYDQFRRYGGVGPSVGGVRGRRATAGASGGIDLEGLGGLDDLFGSLFGGLGGTEAAGGFPGGGTGGGSRGFPGGDGGRRTRRAAPRRGGHVRTNITVPFDVALRGGTLTLKVPRRVQCPECSGIGTQPGTRISACSQCSGRGYVNLGQGGFSIQRPCPTCGGRGERPDAPCTRCHGAGDLEDSSTVEVKIPAGIGSGQVVRLAGLGNAGAAGAPPGDLLVVVSVAPHPRFTRRGRDLATEVAVPMVDAALGGSVDVATPLAGTVTVKVPPGTQPGSTLRLKGLGVQTRGGAGDLLVTLKVSIPRGDTLPEAQRTLLEQFRRQTR